MASLEFLARSIESFASCKRRKLARHGLDVEALRTSDDEIGLIVGAKVGPDEDEDEDEDEYIKDQLVVAWYRLNCAAVRAYKIATELGLGDGAIGTVFDHASCCHAHVTDPQHVWDSSNSIPPCPYEPSTPLIAKIVR
ncbi:hypothetical protein N7470_007589 [Penicillium chermesinum]|nr:hypothetical protein N7470_007589 [Penicillium chermesinum]